MRKKSLLLLSLLFIGGGLLSATGTQATEDTAGVVTFDMLEIYDRYCEDYSLVDDYLLERHKIVFSRETVDYPSSDEKLSLLFNTGQYPDASLWWVKRPFAKRMGAKGYLINVLDQMDKLPNYRNGFSDENWEVMLKLAASPDGALYTLPRRNPWNANMSWFYRKGTLDKWGLEWPDTMDGLLALGKEIKKRDPNSIPFTTRHGVEYALRPFLFAWHTDYRIFKDPDTNEISYGPFTEKYREVLSFVNELFAEGILDPEFPTRDGVQQREQIARGTPYMVYDTAWGYVEWNIIMGERVPDADIIWDLEFVKVDADDEVYIQRHPPIGSRGAILTDKLTGTKLERMLEFLNWSTSEEGQIFWSFGVEGKTFNYVDGVPDVNSDIIWDYENPDKTNLKDAMHFGFTPFSFYHPIYRDSFFGPYPGQFMDAVKDLKGYEIIAWNYTTEEQEQTTDYQVALEATRDEYATKFIMGLLDPNDDGDWQDYINQMKKVRVEEYIELHRGVYDRVYNR